MIDQSSGADEFDVRQPDLRGERLAQGGVQRVENRERAALGRRIKGLAQRSIHEPRGQKLPRRNQDVRSGLTSSEIKEII